MDNISNDAGLHEPVAAEVIGQNSPIEDDDTYKGKVKVINTMTGEIMEREYTSVHEIKNLLQELDGTAKAIKRAQDRLKSLLEEFMASYDEYHFADGDVVRWVTPTKREYRVGALINHGMDLDTIALFSTVGKSKLEDYLNECVKNREISPDDRAAIMQTAEETQGTPYIKIGRK